tara:strand:+ start:384 stop:1121 length:738 start_codon:yes stop_codon:yes gene_type:complete
MTLPSSGAISFDNLRTERAVGGSVSLGDMYRTGLKVPVCPNTSNIPSSGAISMSSFYGQAMFQYGLTWLHANNLVAGKVSEQGFCSGTTVCTNVNGAHINGGTIGNGTLDNSGNRILWNTMRYNTFSGAATMVLTFIEGTNSFSNTAINSNAGDLNRSNFASKIGGKTIAVRNGTATSGSTIFSFSIPSSSNAGEGVTSTNTGQMFSSSTTYGPGTQQNSFRIDVPSVNIGSGLTAGQTYTATIG